MYQQPAPAERPDSVTRGAYAASATAVAQLLTTAATVGFATWAGDDDSSPTVSVFFVVWGVVSASLLILAAVLTLRGRNGGRVLFYVVGIVGLLNHILCGVYNGIAGAEIERLSGVGSDHPPMWLAAVGMTGSVLGIVAAVAGLVYYGRRTSRDWLKPPPPPIAYMPRPPGR